MVGTRRFEDFTKQTNAALAAIAQNQAVLSQQLNNVAHLTTMPTPFAKVADRAVDLDGDVVVLATKRGAMPAAEMAFSQSAREWAGTPGLRWRVFHHDGSGAGLVTARQALGIQQDAAVIAVRHRGRATTRPLPDTITPESLKELVSEALYSLEQPSAPPR